MSNPVFEINGSVFRHVPTAAYALRVEGFGHHIRDCMFSTQAPVKTVDKESCVAELFDRPPATMEELKARDRQIRDSVLAEEDGYLQHDRERYLEWMQGKPLREREDYLDVRDGLILFGMGYKRLLADIAAEEAAKRPAKKKPAPARRFYAESDGVPNDMHYYVVDKYADPVSIQRRTDCESMREARKLARLYNENSPWPIWDVVQAKRDASQRGLKPRGPLPTQFSYIGPPVVVQLPDCKTAAEFVTRALLAFKQAVGRDAMKMHMPLGLWSHLTLEIDPSGELTLKYGQAGLWLWGLELGWDVVGFRLE